MKKLPGVLLRTTKSMNAYALMIRNYTILQQQVMPNVSEVLSLGVIDRRLSILRKEIDDNLEQLCTTGLDEEETLKILALCDLDSRPPYLGVVQLAKKIRSL